MYAYLDSSDNVVATSKRFRELYELKVAAVTRIDDAPVGLVAKDADGYSYYHQFQGTGGSSLDDYVQVVDLTWPKAVKKHQINEITDQLCLEGFAFGGERFSLTIEDIIIWIGMMTMKDVLTAQGAFPIDVTTLDDRSIEIADATEVVQFVSTAMVTWKTHRDSGRALKAAVDAATTTEELDAVTDDRRLISVKNHMTEL